MTIGEPAAGCVGGPGRVKPLFEHSPWVEERADAGFASGDRHADLMRVVHTAGRDEQLALIRAHPELAEKVRLTDASAAEQASVGLDRLTPDEHTRFQALNTAYRERFGFPFIVCARLSDKAGILSAMTERLDNDVEAEIATALAEIGKITKLRLADAGLATLEGQVAHDLACLNVPAPDWLAPRPGVYDVVIIGGGQSGLGVAFGLRRERIGNVLVLDENPAGREGPWDTYARMRTLRTPKMLTGIDGGVPSLTFRAWWEAQHGLAAWDRLDKIGRSDWIAYLCWFRRVLDLPVRNGAKVTIIEPQGDGTHRIHLDDGGSLLARKVVLATGIQGGGEWHVPRFISDALPARRYAHTSQPIDYRALAGKRIAILGGGASAFDNATAALEAGAAQVHVHVRRPELPRVNPIRYMERAGMLPRYPVLDDAAKYDVMASFLRRNQPPTTDMFERAAAYPDFALHTGSPWIAVMEEPAGVRVTTPKGDVTYDFLVLSTGMVTDPALRPELAQLADGIARWRDRYSPPCDLANPVIDAHPYLGAAFELTGRTPADTARLRGLFAFNYSALISHGLSAAALSGLAYAIPRLVRGIADQLFLDHEAQIVADYHAYADEEFTAVWPPLAEAAE